MKIVFFEIKGWEKKHLDKALKGHKLMYHEEPLTIENVAKAKDADVVSVFIYSQLTKEVVKKLSKLKLVTTRSTGFDYIDLKACKAKKVPVCNVPFYGENTVAEHTFALMLSLSRNIHKSYVRTLKNDFSIEGLQGFDLKGKTLGVVGGGSIGLHVIRMAKSFGMEVIVNDISQNSFLAEVLGFKYVSFEELLKTSDIISLNAPDNKNTHHMINKQTIKLIKKGAILINTARGGLVDIDALIEALDKKIIAGAGLDVVEGEKSLKEEKQLLYDKKKSEAVSLLIKNHILFDNDNVIFTPHIAFYSKEALIRILETTAENIDICLKGDCQNVVN